METLCLWLQLVMLLQEVVVSFVDACAFERRHCVRRLHIGQALLVKYMCDLDIYRFSDWALQSGTMTLHRVQCSHRDSVDAGTIRWRFHRLQVLGYVRAGHAIHCP